tara:strand:- start:406 stop:765 length:360 start_codon:yes stop_codon:yes gene_type:complete
LKGLDISWTTVAALYTDCASAIYKKSLLDDQFRHVWPERPCGSLLETPKALVLPELVMTYWTRPAESLGQAVLPVAMGPEGFIQDPATKEKSAYIAMRRVGADCSEFTNQLLLFLYALL